MSHGSVDDLGSRLRSSASRSAAGEDAGKIDGVYEVVDHLKVSVLVPSDSVDAKVRDGWVTLTGQVSEQYQNDAAYDDVSRLYGVYGITNEIVVKNL